HGKVHQHLVSVGVKAKIHTPIENILRRPDIFKMVRVVTKCHECVRIVWQAECMGEISCFLMGISAAFDKERHGVFYPAGGIAKAVVEHNKGALISIAVCISIYIFIYSTMCRVEVVEHEVFDVGK